MDTPVLMPRPGKGYLDVRLPGLVWARKPGSRGWNEVVERLLDEYAKVATQG